MWSDYAKREVTAAMWSGETIRHDVYSRGEAAAAVDAIEDVPAYFTDKPDPAHA